MVWLMGNESDFFKLFRLFPYGRLMDVSVPDQLSYVQINHKLLCGTFG